MGKQPRTEPLREDAAASRTEAGVQDYEGPVGGDATPVEVSAQQDSKAWTDGITRSASLNAASGSRAWRTMTSHHEGEGLSECSPRHMKEEEEDRVTASGDGDTLRTGEISPTDSAAMTPLKLDDWDELVLSARVEPTPGERKLSEEPTPSLRRNPKRHVTRPPSPASLDLEASEEGQADDGPSEARQPRRRLIPVVEITVDRKEHWARRRSAIRRGRPIKYAEKSASALARAEYRRERRKPIEGYL